MLRPILQSMGQGYLDARVKSGDVVVRVVEFPGRWMSGRDLSELSADLRQVAQSALAEDLTYGIFSGDAERLKHSILTVVYRADGTPIAFNALAMMTLDLPPKQIEVLHLGLVMVDRKERSKNLSWVLYGLTCFLLFFRRQFRPIWISNVTQVPAVVGMVSAMFSDIYPRPRDGHRSLRHVQLARRIMNGHRHVFGVGEEAGFDEERFVITNAYTGGSDALKKTFEAAPKHRDDQYNQFCADHLDYDRGDDVLQLGRMDMAAMQRYLRRSVPKSALAGVLVTAAFATVQRLILPVIHWLDSSTDWSILRARS